MIFRFRTRSICTLSLLLVMIISGCIGNQSVAGTHILDAPGGVNTVIEQSDIHQTDLVDKARVTPTKQETPANRPRDKTLTPEAPGGASTMKNPTPTSQGATGKFNGWVALEDPGYGFRFAVPCFWQVDFPEEYLSHQAYSIRNYTYEYVLSFPNQAEEIWKRGGIKIDLVTPSRSPRGVSMADYVTGLHNEEGESRLVSTEEVLINDQGALLVTTESIFGIGQYYVFELTEDAFLLFSPSPGALGNPDVQGILHSIAIQPDARVVMPDFPPGYPLEGAITGCRDVNELEALMTGPKSIAWGSGLPVKIHFALRNLTDRRLYVLDWFTPFEEVAEDIFQVTRDGVPVPYHGVLASRVDPSPDSFLQIEPKGAIFTEVNLYEAYDFSRPGRYMIAFKSPPSSYVARSNKNLSVTLDELGPVYIPSDELIIEIVAQERPAVRSLVEGFGKRLATVSLQSPNAAEEMKVQYAQFVSQDLLEGWMSNPLTAPGRMVSSPWPDRIEITSLTKEGADRYIVHALVIEVTSMEVVQGGAAAEIPVVIELQKNQGRWVITGYSKEAR